METIDLNGALEILNKPYDRFDKDKMALRVVFRDLAARVSALESVKETKPKKKKEEEPGV